MNLHLMMQFIIKRSFCNTFDNFIYQMCIKHHKSMIRFKLAELIEKKQFAEGRRITIQEVATATGINRMTLSKILNQRGYNTGTENIDKLCEYFGCDIADVMEYSPDEQALKE